MKTEPSSANPIVVTHALGKYPVYVQPGGLQRLEELIQLHLPHRRVAMIADAAVYELYRSGRWGRPAWTGESLTLPAGETSKTRDQWSRLTDQLLEQQFGRDSALLALGGGVTGDLAGFVAATYMRGLPYLQIPTTLLAMLDASVGGKTGVDTPYGKNLVGAFHPPVAVLADPLTLTTLADREYRSGLAEAVKHGLVADKAYFEWMESQVSGLTARHPETLTLLIRRSIEIKAEIVSADEREAGRRAILNAGHTVGHALEQVSGYNLPHGEAVGLGLLVECELAETLGITPPGLRARVAGLLGRLGLPQRLAGGIEPDALLDSMGRDKKNRNAQIRFALASDLGQMYSGDEWTTPAPDAAIRRAIGGLL